MAKAHSVVVLCLVDKVLREVAKETTTAGILARLENLYLTKSLANRLCMKQRLYSYKFLDEKGVLEQLKDFNKAIDDLENIDVTIGDEDKAILLLNALPRSYNHIRDAMMYGREGTIKFMEVQSALRAKELQDSGSKVGDSTSESLNIKGFKGKKAFKKKYDGPKTSGANQKESRVCFWCKKLGHLKKDCFGWKKKQTTFGNQSTNTSDYVESNEAAEALNVMETIDGASWIMDSGCSFHICPILIGLSILMRLLAQLFLETIRFVISRELDPSD